MKGLTGLVILIILLGNGVNAIMNDNDKSVGYDNIRPSFDFKDALFKNHSLFVWVESLNKNTGEVVVSGVDTRKVKSPFSWYWGDGCISIGWFAQRHVYSDTTKNYILKVVSYYPDGEKDEREVLIRFLPPKIDFKPLSKNLSVVVPDHKIEIKSRLPGYRPPKLTYFDDKFFPIISRKVVEYVLSVASQIQMDFANDNVYMINGSFIQYLLRDPPFGGGYTLWYADPVSFAMGDCMMRASIQWSALFHEMGHDVTLNSPADYFYGGKIDGNANAIFSETMAQIFQHSAAYEIINNADNYGLSEDLIFEIRENAISTMIGVKNVYDDYIKSGMKFSSWNDPKTPEDETGGTVMTIAYKFFEHAEKSDSGYRIPLKRMMLLLQTFCEKDRERYSQFINSPKAESFRATLMVAALSFAFDEDLRDEFRKLNFPIDDEVYEELIGRGKIYCNVSVDKPKNHLYLWDKEILGLKNMSIIIGPVTVEISAKSNIGVDKVEIYVDGNLKKNFTDRPYNCKWRWNEPAFGKHAIKAIAYDFSNNVAADTRNVWIFNMG